jgi:hypothetical protein
MGDHKVSKTQTITKQKSERMDHVSENVPVDLSQESITFVYNQNPME